MKTGPEGWQGSGMEGPDDGDVPLPQRLLEQVRAEYHASPATPRDVIWARIEAARHPTVRRPWLRYITGIAALLALGIGIGRITSRSSVPATVTAAAPNRSGAAFAITTVNHLSRVETFLTALRTAPGEEQFAGQARELLTSTRLLLDSPGTADPRMRALLEDLELILVQVTTLDGRSDREELELITDGLEQREVLPRLRTAIPAGTARQL